MSLGKTTFGINKGEFTRKLGVVITNNRANSRLIGRPKDFVLRACRLSDQWLKMATDPEVVVVIRNIEIAGGRKVKMICLEKGGKRQPVSKAKLIDALYPPKSTATAASPEEKHYNSVKSAMRLAVNDQLTEFRKQVELPTLCYLSGMEIRPGMRTDVDHVDLSFSEIADSFLIMRGFQYSDLTLEGPPTAKRFKDKILWKEWQEYHRQKARFSLVMASANRSKGSEGYKTPHDLYGSFERQSEEDIALDF